MSAMPEMSPESRDNTGRPNLGLSLVLRLTRRIEDLMLAACMALEAAKEVAEIRALWPRKTAQWRR
jgi:hypothetical protein